MSTTNPTLSSAPSQSSSLSVWLNYMQQIHVSAIDMGLSRVLPVAEQLGIVQSAKDDAYVFTVAGTNGKGSTTAVIAEICQQAGYKTALYQSPHLIDFNERVRINGQPVGDQTLVNAFCEVEQARLLCGLTLSFFEMTTLAAMLIFAQADCDVWVLEVGLGGRLDVVNIIDPDLAVITNIGIDHVDWLGDTREKIGFEKAGILRPNGLLIYGEADMPQSVQDKVAELGVRCYQADRDFAHVAVQPQMSLTAESGEPVAVSQWQYSNGAVTLQLPKPPLSLINTANAISAVLASPLSVSADDVAAAMQQVHLPGRLDQRTLADRHWLFDVAHNVEGIDFVLPQLLSIWQAHRQHQPKARLHLLFSMLGDKPIAGVVAQLQQSELPIVHWHVAAIDHPRAAELSTLEQVLSEHVTAANITTYESLAIAAEGVIASSTGDDMIVVCGSFHTIAEVLIGLKAVALPY